MKGPIEGKITERNRKMRETTVKGTIMSSKWGMPTYSERTVKDKNGVETTLKVCRFKISEDGQTNSEPVQVEVVNQSISDYLTAGRRIEVRGRSFENPKAAMKDGQIKTYANPTISANIGGITLLDLPLTKQIGNVLKIVEEHSFLNEETLNELRTNLEAVAKEKFESGRQVFQPQIPNEIDTQPSDNPEENPF